MLGHRWIGHVSSHLVEDSTRAARYAAVVATGRDIAKIRATVGDHDNLLAFKLDVTKPRDAQAAVEAAVAGWYFYQMPAKEKAWCGYCITGALANFAIFALTLPEAGKALKVLRGR